MLAEYDLSFWQGAACRGMGNEAFYGLGSKTNPSTVPAICATCPVREPCGEHGIHYEKAGTWGGMTQQRIREIRRQRGISVPRD